MKELLSLLNNIHPVTPLLQQYLFRTVQQHQFSKKDFLLKAGEISHRVYFIKKGLLRAYYLENGQEICSKFMKEGDLIVSVISFFKQKPGYEYIQAIEDCEVYSLRYDELQYMYKNFRELNIIARVLISKYYVLSEQRLYFLRKKKAAERYYMMVRYFPRIMLRVPDKYIASFLGISKETISRIRSGKY
jgi:CRP-like cAMP-binding protein